MSGTPFSGGEKRRTVDFIYEEQQQILNGNSSQYFPFLRKLFAKAVETCYRESLHALLAHLFHSGYCIHL